MEIIRGELHSKQFNPESEHNIAVSYAHQIGKTLQIALDKYHGNLPDRERGQVNAGSNWTISSHRLINRKLYKIQKIFFFKYDAHEQ